VEVENNYARTVARIARQEAHDFVDKLKQLPGAGSLVVVARSLMHIAVVRNKDQEQSLAVGIRNHVSL
jgi:hypothetical protein